MPKPVETDAQGADDAAQRLRTILRQTYLKRFSLRIETVSVTVKAPNTPQKAKNGKARTRK